MSLGCPKPGRFRTHPDPAAYRRVRRGANYDDAELVVVPTPAASSTARCKSPWKPSVRPWPRTAGDRHRLPGCQREPDPRIHPKVLEITGPHAYEEVLGHVHKYVEKTHPQPLHQPGAGPRCQADPAPLRLSQDLRRLQPPLHLLHHSLHARGSGEPSPSAKCWPKPSA